MLTVGFAYAGGILTPPPTAVIGATLPRRYEALNASICAWSEAIVAFRVTMVAFSAAIVAASMIACACSAVT